jgi:hypothetical protein
VLKARTRSLRAHLPLFVAAVALALVMAALCAAATIQAAAYRSDFSRVTLTPAAREASCTAAQKANRQAVLRVYRKRMRAQRRAYFRTHASPGLRTAFIRRQRARLRRLQAAAACTVTTPPAPPEPPPAPPAPPEPGHYSGLTSQGYGVGIDVTADGSAVTRFTVSRLDDACTPQRSFVNTIFSDSSSSAAYTIRPGGFFSLTGGGTAVSNGITYRFRVVLRGDIVGPNAQGTLRITTMFTEQGTDYTCTAGDLTWTATHTG